MLQRNIAMCGYQMYPPVSGRFYKNYCISATGIPPTPPALNLPTPDTGSNAAYNSSVALFQASINTGADACKDFYGYACGKYDKAVSFRVVDAKNFKTQADQMSKDVYKNTSVVLF